VTTINHLQAKGIILIRNWLENSRNKNLNCSIQIRLLRTNRTIPALSHDCPGTGLGGRSIVSQSAVPGVMSTRLAICPLTGALNQAPSGSCKVTGKPFRGAMVIPTL